MSARVSTTLGASAWAKLHPTSVLVPDILRFTGGSGGLLYSIAGTTNVFQWLKLLWTTDQRATTGLPGKVFGAFADIAEATYDLIRLDVAANANGQAVLLTGHSLGGVLADVVGRRLAAAGLAKVSGIVSWGCPRIGDAAYAAAATRPEHVRIVIDTDNVPMVPPPTFLRKPDGPVGVGLPIVPAQYRHGPGDVTLYTLENTRKPDFPRGDIGNLRQALDALAAMRNVHGTLGTHPMKEYATRAYAWAGRIQDAVRADLFNAYVTLHEDLLALGY